MNDRRRHVHDPKMSYKVGPLKSPPDSRTHAKTSWCTYSAPSPHSPLTIDVHREVSNFASTAAPASILRVAPCESRGAKEEAINDTEASATSAAHAGQRGLIVTTLKDLLQPAHSRQKLRALLQRLRSPGSFTESGSYWEQRYSRGGTSGAGSYGALGAAKAAFLNEFVREHGVLSVIELGCGDGNQLSLANYPSYIGLDVSETAIEMCKRRFAGDLTKTFCLYDSSLLAEERSVLSADLALSLDVIYHLVEDAIFETYMNNLFALSKRYTVVYSTNALLSDEGLHVRHRHFSPWVEKNCQQWRLAQVTRGLALADFFVYERITESAGC